MHFCQKLQNLFPQRAYCLESFSLPAPQHLLYTPIAPAILLASIQHVQLVLLQWCVYMTSVLEYLVEWNSPTKCNVYPNNIRWWKRGNHLTRSMLKDNCPINVYLHSKHLHFSWSLPYDFSNMFWFFQHLVGEYWQLYKYPFSSNFRYMEVAQIL